MKPKPMEPKDTERFPDDWVFRCRRCGTVGAT